VHAVHADVFEDINHFDYDDTVLERELWRGGHRHPAHLAGGK
jgi:hypothetical protein